MPASPWVARRRAVIQRESAEGGLLVPGIAPQFSAGRDAIGPVC